MANTSQIAVLQDLITTKLSPNNIDEWRRKIEGVLKPSGLFGILEGTIAAANASVDENLAGLLMSTMNLDAISRVTHCQSSREIWDFVASEGFRNQPLFNHGAAFHLFKVIEYYGSEHYPFCTSKLNRLNFQNQELRFTVDPFPRFPIKSDMPDVWTLSRLLVVNEYSAGVVHKFDLEGKIVEHLPIGILEDRHVAIYLLSLGDALPNIVRICDECMSRGREFEVVVVYSVEEDERNRLFDLLRKYSICTSWWFLPFTPSVSQRLTRLSHEFLGFGGYPDRVIMVLPGLDRIPHYTKGHRMVDLQAVRVIQRFGVDGYPFSRAVIYHRALCQVRNAFSTEFLTSIFSDADYVYRADGVAEPALSLLMRTRPTFILFANVRNIRPYALKAMVETYERGKEVRLGVEVVFVPVNDDGLGEQMSMPWYYCPFNANRSKLLIGRLRGLKDVGISIDVEARDTTLIGALEGECCSLRSPALLKDFGIPMCPYFKILPFDVIRLLEFHVNLVQTRHLLPPLLSFGL